MWLISLEKQIKNQVINRKVLETYISASLEAYL